MIKITPAKLADAAVIQKLETKVWGQEVVNKYDAPMFIKLGFVFVARHGKKIVGAICSYVTKNNEVHICDWVVDAKYRGQGIGLKLFKKLVRADKNKPLISFINVKNTASIEAHKKLGFIFKKIAKSDDPYYKLEGGQRVVARLNSPGVIHLPKKRN